jgi:pilus assembly protein CpaD
VKGLTMNKGNFMSTRGLAIAASMLALGLGGCGINPAVDRPSQGVSAVNVPVVSRQDFAFDVAAPDGMLASGEAGRLDAWFHSLNLGYGDSVSVDGGAFAPGIRGSVAQIAGQYGLMLNEAAPVTPGALAPGFARVVVSRTRASVPNCPNWGHGGGRENWQNQSLPGSGCAVNGNLAAMIANPNDLVFGREGSGLGDATTSGKAVSAYRSARTTGERGLQDITTQKKGGN